MSNAPANIAADMMATMDWMMDETNMGGLEAYAKKKSEEAGGEEGGAAATGRNL